MVLTSGNEQTVRSGFWPKLGKVAAAIPFAEDAVQDRDDGLLVELCHDILLPCGGRRCTCDALIRVRAGRLVSL